MPPSSCAYADARQILALLELLSSLPEPAPMLAVLLPSLLMHANAAVAALAPPGGADAPRAQSVAADSAVAQSSARAAAPVDVVRVDRDAGDAAATRADGRGGFSSYTLWKATTFAGKVAQPDNVKAAWAAMSAPDKADWAARAAVENAARAAVKGGRPVRFSTPVRSPARSPIRTPPTTSAVAAATPHARALPFVLPTPSTRAAVAALGALGQQERALRSGTRGRGPRA
jgi:hypothetical protein